MCVKAFILIASCSDVTFSVTDLIKPPDLNQARVNKCLIALVNRKVVVKESSTVSFLQYFSQLLVHINFREQSCTTGKAFREMHALVMISKCSLISL